MVAIPLTMSSLLVTSSLPLPLLESYTASALGNPNKETCGAFLIPVNGTHTPGGVFSLKP